MSRRARLTRAFYLSATVALVMAGVVELALLVPYMQSQQALGADYRFFRDIAQHWLDTGEFYPPLQLAGPYEVQTLVSVLYPPIALYLFVPFTVLPAILWWATPFGLYALGIAWLRPARWTWPVIAAGIVWPQTLAQVLYGNTNMWIAAFIAAGVAFAWPSVLILVKPSLAPFALIGIHRRRWWVAMGVLVLAALPFGSMWIDYATVIRNSSLSAGYALVTLPLMLAPFVAWLGRDRAGRAGHLEMDAPAEAVPDVDDLALDEVE